MTVNFIFAMCKQKAWHSHINLANDFIIGEVEVMDNVPSYLAT